MLDLGSIYLIVKDMGKSILFYEKLLEMKVTAQNHNRWAQFNFNGKCIALFNPQFDEDIIGKGSNLEQHYSREYLEYILNKQTQYGNNFVLNFYIDDLLKEYKRIKELGLGIVTKLMYLNIASPYHFFQVEDPDGNIIEITGEYVDSENTEGN